MARINFFNEDLDFKLPKAKKTVTWLKTVIQEEDHSLNNLNFIFCSDSYLLKINEGYLQHTTLTDIITFDHSEEAGIVEGDIFISINRVEENASKYKRPFLEELNRIMVHGVLHLIGYNDKTASQKQIMRKKENAYLSLLFVPRET